MRQEQEGMAVRRVQYLVLGHVTEDWKHNAPACRGTFKTPDALSQLILQQPDVPPGSVIYVEVGGFYEPLETIYDLPTSSLLRVKVTPRPGMCSGGQKVAQGVVDEDGCLPQDPGPAVVPHIPPADGRLSAACSRAASVAAGQKRKASPGDGLLNRSAMKGPGDERRPFVKTTWGAQAAERDWRPEVHLAMTYLFNEVKTYCEVKASYCGVYQSFDGLFMEPAIDYLHGRLREEYLELIEHPICLADIKVKLKKGHYCGPCKEYSLSSFDALVEDLYLMVNNCKDFNHDGERSDEEQTDEIFLAALELEGFIAGIVPEYRKVCER